MYFEICKIIRDEKDNLQGDFGKLYFDTNYFCEVLQPDVLNESQTPSRFHLPANDEANPYYECVRYNSPKHGWTFVIQRPTTPYYVGSHSFLEFHAGNTVEDTLGCTVMGSTRDKLKGERAVLNSGNTFKKFMTVLEGIDKFKLIVVDNYV